MKKLIGVIAVIIGIISAALIMLGISGFIDLQYFSVANELGIRVLAFTSVTGLLIAAVAFWEVY
jgi:hypothetical protein